ncbi:MAG: ATP-binding protein [Burkholderiales bacterium]|nr:ATP-binding protein [Burkholderiales bacterium]
MTLKLNFDVFATEQRLCEKHKQEYSARMFMRNDGSQFWSTCPSCREENELAKRRQEHIEQQTESKKRLVAKLFNQSAIPPRFSDDTFDNYIADTADKLAVKNTMLGFAHDIKANLKIGRNVLLAGNPGNGKTHLSVAAAKSAIDSGYTALFTTVGEMIDKINEAGWNKATAIANYTIPDLLILDEVTYTLNSEEQKNLFKVLNKRYEQIRSTIIQTNLSILDLKNVLGERIIDRLRENGGIVLYFTWESYRK